MKISLWPIKAIACIKKPWKALLKSFFYTQRASFHSYFLALRFPTPQTEGLYQNKQFNPKTAFKNYIVVNNTEGMQFHRAVKQQ